MAADPSAQVLHFPPPVGQLEVVPPAIDVLPPPLTQLLTGFALPRIPSRPDLLLESIDRFGGYPNAAILLALEPEPQQTASAAWPRAALLPLDFQPEVLFSSQAITLSKMRPAARSLAAKMAMSSA